MRMTMSTRARGVVYPALFMLMVCFSLSGCSMGPKALKGNRLDYNVSIQKSNNEELLINLVRARYYEPLFFLQAGSIFSSFSYTVNAALAGQSLVREVIYSQIPAHRLSAPVMEKNLRLPTCRSRGSRR